MKYLVEALDTYEKNGMKDKVLGYIPKVGEQFEVDEERLNVLLGNNAYNKIFVKKVEKPVIKEQKKVVKKKITK